MSNYEDVEQLQSQIAALKELLSVYEQTALAQSKQLEQAIQELQERTRLLEHSEATLEVLQSILDSMGDSVVVSDRQGKFLFCNPAAKDLLDIRSTDDFLEDWVKRYEFYLPNQSNPYPFNELPWEQVKQGKIVDSAEIFMPRVGNLRNIWLMVNAKPLNQENGSFNGSVFVFQNITKQKQVEDSLRQSNTLFSRKTEQLEKALQELHDTQTQLIQTEKMSSLGQLVAGVAHEINNPVNFIHGNIGYLKQYSQELLELICLYQQHFPNSHQEIQEKIEEIDLEFIGEDLPKILSSVELGTLRIRDIVESLRNFARLDEAELKSVDIHEGIDSALMILNNRLKNLPDQDSIEIIKNYKKLPKIECYAGQINQVFMNILINAIEALEESSERKKKITICTDQPVNDQIQIAICDNGPGMSEFALAHIFDPFFTTKPIGKGTGLGMSISYQIIVNQHNGMIHCMSVLGQGAEFIIEIPLTQ